MNSNQEELKMNEKALDNIIDEYLKKVKKALPDWLKEKKEHKEILADLSEHIWQKANELSDTGQATEMSIRKAISHMGTPQAIAKEYKRRGEPKVYITKEMWPLYTRVLGIVFVVIIALTLFGSVMSYFTELTSFETMIASIVEGIQVGLLTAFAIITIIFAALSMEGYFPEDFKSKKEQRMKRELVKKAAAEGLPYSEEERKLIKPFIKPVGEIIGGCIGLIFGIIFLLQPFDPNILLPDFSILLRFFGAIITIQGSLDISRGIIGNHKPATHQVIHGFTIAAKLAVIPLLIILMNRPEIFPWFSTPWIQVGIPVEFYEPYRVIMTVIIVIVCLTTIEDIYKIIKIEKYKI
jgi:uncharacterized membrane-anchored protein